ncbi:hypothetical protein Tco_0353042 [Tanacetum coccineum]
MSDWRLLCHRRKRLFKLSLMSSRTLCSTRHSLSLMKSLKFSCSSSGTLLRRIQGVDFAELPDDETTLTFLFDIGYKDPLYNHTIMYVDHMHQPWRTLASIINKCLFGSVVNHGQQRSNVVNSGETCQKPSNLAEMVELRECGEVGGLKGRRNDGSRVSYLSSYLNSNYRLQDVGRLRSVRRLAANLHICVFMTTALNLSTKSECRCQMFILNISTSQILPTRAGVEEQERRGKGWSPGTKTADTHLDCFVDARVRRSNQEERKLEAIEEGRARAIVHVTHAKEKDCDLICHQPCSARRYTFATEGITSGIAFRDIPSGDKEVAI